MLSRTVVSRVAVVSLLALAISPAWGRGGHGGNASSGGNTGPGPGVGSGNPSGVGGGGGFRGGASRNHPGGAGGESGISRPGMGGPGPTGSTGNHQPAVPVRDISHSRSVPTAPPYSRVTTPSHQPNLSHQPHFGEPISNRLHSRGPSVQGGAVGIHRNQPAMHRESFGGNHFGEVRPDPKMSQGSGMPHGGMPHSGEVRHPGGIQYGVRISHGPDRPHGGPGAFRGEMLHSPGAHWNGYHQAYIGQHPVRLAHAGYHPSYYHHPWHHGPWGGQAWGWGWGYGPGVTFRYTSSGWGAGTDWGYPGYGYPDGPYGYGGRPLGWGLGGWGLGTTVYTSGYYVYENPYCTPIVAQTMIYDYSQPIPVSTQPLPSGVTSSLPGLPPIEGLTPGENPAFGIARDSFRNGDYPAALREIDAAIQQSPTDAVVHEFRSLVLFALHDYHQSAAVIHSVLAVGPGWNYTTLSSLYPNPFVYSDQLRQLEDFTRENPRMADAHFLLAYHDLINSRKEGAIAELQQVLNLIPGDRLASELLAMVKGPPKVSQPVAVPVQGRSAPKPRTIFDGTSDPLLSDPPNPLPASSKPNPLKPVDASKLWGIWNATREDGARFQLILTDDSQFTWVFTAPNQAMERLSGHYNIDGPVLVLERQEGGGLAGTAEPQSDAQFHFKLVGGPSEDPGLDFSKE